MRCANAISFHESVPRFLPASPAPRPTIEDYVMNIRRLLCTGALALPASLVLPATRSKPASPVDTLAVVQQGAIAEMPPASWVEDDPADSLYKAAREAIN